MSILRSLCNKIENFFTFKPHYAIPANLSHFHQTATLLEHGGRQISVRYKLTDSPYFIFFSHGNGSSVDSIAHIYAFYEELGVSYLAYDYPGYGKSAGSLSAEGCYDNFNLVYDFIVSELKISPDTIVCHGLSLGGAVTIHAGVNKPIRKFILEATFTSGADMARHKFPFVPGIEHISSQFKSIDDINKLQGEVLFIHGENDRVIPVDHSRRLFKKSTATKYLYIIPNCEHSGHYASGGARYKEMWQTFLAAGVQALL